MEKRDREIGIIGLGQFGMQLGKTLAQLGYLCIGLDMDVARAQLGRDIFAQTYIGDGMDKQTLSQLKIHTLHMVVVALGSRLEASILTILNLQELGVENIVAQAASPLNKKVLERMGVSHIVTPETDAAARLAYSIENPGLIELLPIGRGVALQENIVEQWSGKTLKELNVRNANKILVAAIREKGKADYSFVPDPNRKLQAGESLLIIGYAEDVAALRGRT